MSVTMESRAVIEELLKGMVEKKASDLHLTIASPPTYRINGVLTSTEREPLTPEALQELVYAVLSEEQRAGFIEHKELDFSYSLPGVSRYRGNVLLQRGAMGAVFRAIPQRPSSLDELGFPPVLKTLCKKPRGLILVTGPTGSGKSTTLAAMIEHINDTAKVHIVTIEDPIEFLYQNKKAIIRQRELGQDTHSFSEALKHVLRQDPDVILVGEMRDLETISLAVTAAETGHLVFATLHTTGAPSTVDRIVDVFPPHQQQQIRVQVSSTIEGVVSQTLVPTVDGKGRACAMEIMIATTAIRNLVREGKSHQIVSAIQSGASVGMVTLNTSLKNLVTAGKVTFEEALLKSTSAEEFKSLCGRT
ncbi:MAG: type IV pilus twitching motility protein PilT [Candidatus Omnitrophota bacterium]|nr:type IV pilus twitching motility protein PilT [Candidatus Omnitrophota bacterium]